MKRLLLAVAVTLFHVFMTIADEAKEAQTENKKETKCQSICPVMGGKINKNYYVDTDEGRVYFCCQGCISAFKEAPLKYLEKLKKEGVQLEQIQSKEESKTTHSHP